MAEVVTDEVNENVTGQGVEFKVGKAKHPNGLLVDTISELAASASVSFPNALKSNVINEYTATGGGAGVTVDGVLIKDNGLTASGSASLGSLSLTTKLAVADGGTGASSLTDGGVLLGGGIGAITALALLADGEIIIGEGVGFPTTLEAFSSSTGTLKLEHGGKGDSTAAGARTNLGVEIGTDVQAFGAVLDDLNTLGAAAADGEVIVATGAGTFNYESGATLRTSIGVAIGSDVQAFGAVLDDLNTLGAASSDGEMIVATGAGAFAYESGATRRTSIGVAIGSDVQAFGAVLDDLNTLGAAAADGEVIVATGAGAFAYESGATLRTSIGVGTGDSPTFTGLTLTGAFTSPGIDDNATAEQLQVADSAIHANQNTLIGDLTTTPEGQLHVVESASSGMVRGLYDVAVFESNEGSSGVTFTGPNTQNQHIVFADTDANFRGALRYEHNGDKMYLYAGGVIRQTWDGKIIDINQGGENVDTRIRSQNDDNIFYVDAGNDRIGIGTATPAEKLDVNGTVKATAVTTDTLTVNNAPVNVPDNSLSGDDIQGGTPDNLTGLVVGNTTQLPGFGGQIPAVAQHGTDAASSSAEVARWSPDDGGPSPDYSRRAVRWLVSVD